MNNTSVITGKLRINPYFNEFIYNSQRYNVIWGGSGSGKSVAAAQKFVVRCLHEPIKHRLIALRKYKTSIKNSVFEQIKFVLSDAGLTPYVKVNLTDLSFEFPNGSKILTGGMDDPEKIKSAIYTGYWFEEATEFDKEDIQQVDLRLRGEIGTYKQIIYTFNPISEDNFLKGYFFDNPDPEVYSLHSTYLHNRMIDEEYKTMLESRCKHDENLYRIYVLGQWGRIRTGHEFYSSFNYNRHVANVPYVDGSAVHVSFDQNVVPYITATLWQIINTDGRYQIRQFDEFTLENPHNKTESLCRAIIQRYGDKLSNGLYYYGDASGKKRDTRGMDNDYDIVDKIFRPYLNNSSRRIPGVNPSVSKRRDFINRMLSGYYPADILIDKNCKKSIADLENVKEDVDRTKLKEKKKDSNGVSYEVYGHTSDTTDYMLCETFKHWFYK